MDDYPPLNLDHLRTLTDGTGVIQHAIFSIPNRKTGYTTDDNARALSVALRYHEFLGGRGNLRAISTYLSFLHFAQRSDGKFRNFMNYEQSFTDIEGSDDCFGRAVQACAHTLQSQVHENVKRGARDVLSRAEPWFGQLRSLRGCACVMDAMYHRARCDVGVSYVEPVVRRICDFFLHSYRTESRADWRWFEPILCYANASLPATLFLAYELLGEPAWLEVATESFDFLREVTMVDGCLDLVGCAGWWERGGVRAHFDQQPIDAAAFVDCCLAAWRATGEDRYRSLAVTGLDWFLGDNIKGVALYDPATGGCSDALIEEGVNWNQGAESTICFLNAYLNVLLARALPGPRPAVVSNDDHGA